MRTIVRDGAKRWCEENGLPPVGLVFNQEDRMRLLYEKLIEEAKELAEATKQTHQLEELADCYEVLLEIAIQLGFKWRDVNETAIEKSASRGSFCAGYTMERKSK